MWEDGGSERLGGDGGEMVERLGEANDENGAALCNTLGLWLIHFKHSDVLGTKSGFQVDRVSFCVTNGHPERMQWPDFHSIQWQSN